MGGGGYIGELPPGSSGAIGCGCGVGVKEVTYFCSSVVAKILGEVNTTYLKILGEVNTTSLGGGYVLVGTRVVVFGDISRGESSAETLVPNAVGLARLGFTAWIAGCAWIFLELVCYGAC